MVLAVFAFPMMAPLMRMKCNILDVFNNHLGCEKSVAVLIECSLHLDRSTIAHSRSLWKDGGPGNIDSDISRLQQERLTKIWIGSSAPDLVLHCSVCHEPDERRMYSTPRITQSECFHACLAGDNRINGIQRRSGARLEHRAVVQKYGLADCD